MKYRPEIDGLRAVAVLPVIFFHAGSEWFKGGFVGVDVFFVISGYLITSILLNEIEEQKFSLVNFYERRARRLLPALIVVVFLTIPFAYLWLTPKELKDFGQSLIAVSTFSSNFLFWMESGYFDTTAELKPLLHTWSLAVEEQYYVLFPLFLMAVWRFGFKALYGLLILGFVFSFLIANWAVINQPNAAFYLLPTRAWEILLGTFCAIILRKSALNFPISVKNLLSLIGLFSIVFAIIVFDKSTPMPGPWALIPTVGTVLIILFADGNTISNKVLQNKMLVNIGLISYSAYLFHQPIIALFRARNYSEELSWLTMLVVLISTLMLAFISWKYIEEVFRNKNKISTNAVFIFAGFSLVLIFAIGMWINSNNGFSTRFAHLKNVEWSSLSERLDFEGDVCSPSSDSKDLKNLIICQFGDEASTDVIVLYGDSHAQAISRVLDAEAKAKGFKVYRVFLSNCGVIFEVTSELRAVNSANTLRNCNDSFRSLQQFILEKNALTWLVTRWTFQLYPISGYIEQLAFDNRVGGVEKDLPHRVNFVLGKDAESSLGEAAKQEAVIKLLRGIKESSKKTIITYPIPEMGWDIFDENVKHYRSNQTQLKELKYPIDTYNKRNEFILNVLDSETEKNSSYKVLRADLLLCDGPSKGFCVGQYDYIPYYYDDDHVSDFGAKLMVDEFFDLIESQ